MSTEVIQPADLTGQVIGNYHITSRLGRGGMADVYKALHNELKVHRAVKFIRPEFVTSEDFRARFQKEAQAVARLEHPNIVRIHDFGNASNQYYMVMQFVEGQDLKNRLASQGTLTPDNAIDLVASVADALSYAHERDLIHRDIKPENIMLGDKGEPILMDFGIAKLLTENTSLTQTGVGIGTPAYMAPEQAQGQEITPATDIYALAVVLFELVTGRQPYSADTPIAVMLKAISDPLPLPREVNPDISEELQAVILKGTAKDPASRYQNADEFAQDLRAVRGGSQPTIARAAPVAADSGATTVVQNAAPANTAKSGTLMTRLTRWLAWFGGLTIIAAAAAGYWWWNSNEDNVIPGDVAQGVPDTATNETRKDPQGAAQNSPSTVSFAPQSAAQSSPGAEPASVVSAPAVVAPTTKTLPAQELSGGEPGEIYAYRDTLAAGQTLEAPLELEQGETLFLQVHSTEHTSDFKMLQPDGRKTLFSSYNHTGPVEVKESGMHRLSIKSRSKEPTAIDAQLFRVNPAVINGGIISFGDYMSAATQLPGQQLEYQANLKSGDTVFLEVERAETYTDFRLRALDDRSDLFNSYNNTGPHKIERSGAHQFFAKPRGANLTDYEFILHNLNPAVIDGGNYELDSWSKANTSQPGQVVEYQVDLKKDDFIYLEISSATNYTDFRLEIPGRRDELFSHYADTGPHKISRSGVHTLVVDPRNAVRSEFEFRLHRLKPGIIEGGELQLNQAVSASTSQPGQVITYTLTLEETKRVGLEVISATNYTDFTLMAPGGREKVFGHYSSVDPQELAPGTYELLIDPRGRILSTVEFRMAEQP